MTFSLPAFVRPPRFELDAPVVAHEQIIGHEYEITFHAPAIAQAARPGQFLELLFGDNYAPLVRRPFSLYRVDREAGTCSVLYLARGSFTTGLAQKRVGETVSVLGPLGRPFTWPSEPGVRHILIAGGIGAPPIYFLAQEISRDLIARGESTENVIVINGARTRDLLVGMVEFGSLEVELFVTTDDGTHGQRGLVTGLLTSLLDAEASAPTHLCACGPNPMLRAIAAIAIARNLPCQLSVETSMPCGIGICQGCAIKVRDPADPAGFVYARACWDGPIFEARDLLWDE
ncbi:MAG TPA: dihydroorotate dehydrogenase electron transfer subunit [Chthonomonadaceae bacterium]|nr:dihydroorotate dehydrogenase electron transfer subunit [Chthonomonadaceae bacterium]